MSGQIALAETDLEIQACYPVMAELRPQLVQGEFVPLCRRLEGLTGFRLAYLLDGSVVAVAGFRISEWLAHGKYLEIEDLVTGSGHRSGGYGGELFDWLVAHGKRAACDHLRLVSNVTRTDAHRFYQRKGMILQAHYFTLDIR